MIIYKTTNKVNGKIYIGKTKNNTDQYLGSGLLIKRAIAKYGVENFIKEIIDTAETIQELNQKEQYWIQQYNSCDNTIGYNISRGGDGGDVFSNHPNKEQIRKNCSHTGETNGMFGRKHRPESRAKISKSKKGQLAGIPTWNTGKTKKDYSDEHKQNCINCGLKKENHPFAKSFLIIDPNGVEYIVTGTIHDFANQRGFYPTTFRSFRNKGKIPPPPLHNKNPQRLNMTGWEVRDIDKQNVNKD